METRIVFMGSPEFALPALRALAQSYHVVGVVTQPDRPAGRGRSLAPPAVKKLAVEFGIPLIQPDRLRDPEPMAQLQAWHPDIIIVAAFGQILRTNVLEMPPFGCVNIHASLLPRWRGAAPIQAAILQGDNQTGVTIMKMARGVDTGPILSQRSVDIHSDDTAETLSIRLAHLGAKLLLDTLPGFISGEIVPREQDENLATSAPMLSKQDGILDFNQPAMSLARRVRAFQPWPSTSMVWQDLPLKIHRARAVLISKGNPGTRTAWENLPAVCTSDGILVLEEVQPAGRKSIPGSSFLQGARDWEN